MCCSCQLRKLQRQRESYVHEIRDMEEELAALSQHKKTLKDGSCMERVTKSDPSNVFLISILVLSNMF